MLLLFFGSFRVKTDKILTCGKQVRFLIIF